VFNKNTATNFKTLNIKPTKNNTMKTTFFKTLLGLFITLNGSLVSAQAWVPVGDSNFPYTEYSTLALDSNDVPYIFYKNYFDGNTGFVMKFENDSWNAVGEEGFSETMFPGPGNNVGWRTHALVLDSNNISYVAYANTDGKIVVKKLENNQWLFLGEEAISQASATAISLAFDNNNILYVSYMDWNINSLVVKKFEDNNWISVDSSVVSNLLVSNSEITFDSNNNLYIAYVGKEELWSPNKVIIKKNENNTWEDVGSVITTEQDNLFNIALVIDGQDIPYIFYNQSLNTILMKKFEENSWQTVGEIESPDNYLIFSSTAFDYFNIPYISYTTITDNSNITTTIKKYEDNVWQTVGGTNQFNGVSSITFDSNNIPYAVFTATGSTTVRKFDPTAGVATSVFNQVEMYPNPANGVVYIDNLPNDTTVTITDMTGKLIYSTTTTAENINIDTTSFISGLYIVQLTHNSGSIVKKLVKR
jgi:hypothetical protein